MMWIPDLQADGVDDEEDGEEAGDDDGRDLKGPNSRLNPKSFFLNPWKFSHEHSMHVDVFIVEPALPTASQKLDK